MSALLDFDAQIAIKKISANNASKYPEWEFEVENWDLRALLGIELLQDLQANPATTDNANLLNGCTFVNNKGYTVTHKGVLFVLAYLVHSYYIGKSFVSDTFSGFVQKNRPDAAQLSEGNIRRLQEDDRRIALSEFEVVRQFLNANSSLYPLWLEGQKTKPYTPRFSGIKKTGSIGNNSSYTDFITL